MDHGHHPHPHHRFFFITRGNSYFFLETLFWFTMTIFRTPDDHLFHLLLHLKPWRILSFCALCRKFWILCRSCFCFSNYLSRLTQDLKNWLKICFMVPAWAQDECKILSKPSPCTHVCLKCCPVHSRKINTSHGQGKCSSEQQVKCSRKCGRKCGSEQQGSGVMTMIKRTSKAIWKHISAFIVRQS